MSRQEELLEEIAKKLDSISGQLEKVSGHLEGIEASCMTLTDVESNTGLLVTGLQEFHDEYVNVNFDIE